LNNSAGYVAQSTLRHKPEVFWEGLNCGKKMADQPRLCDGSVTAGALGWELRKSKLDNSASVQNFTTVVVTGASSSLPMPKSWGDWKKFKWSANATVQCALKYYVRLATCADCCCDTLVQYEVDAETLKNDTGCKTWFLKAGSVMGDFFARDRMGAMLSMNARCPVKVCNATTTDTIESILSPAASSAVNEVESVLSKPPRLKSRLDWDRRLDWKRDRIPFTMNDQDIQKFHELMDLVGVRLKTWKNGNKKLTPFESMAKLGCKSSGSSQERCGLTLLEASQINWDVPTTAKADFKRLKPECTCSPYQFYPIEGRSKGQVHYFTRLDMERSDSSSTATCKSCKMSYYIRTAKCKHRCGCSTQLPGMKSLVLMESHTVADEKPCCREWFLRTVTGVGFYMGSNRLETMMAQLGTMESWNTCESP